MVLLVKWTIRPERADSPSEDVRPREKPLCSDIGRNQEKPWLPLCSLPVYLKEAYPLTWLAHLSKTLPSQSDVCWETNNPLNSRGNPHKLHELINLVFLLWVWADYQWWPDVSWIQTATNNRAKKSKESIGPKNTKIEIIQRRKHFLKNSS